MTKQEKILEKVRRICLALPETTETPTWGQPHFRVKDKIFAGCGLHDGKQTIGCKLEMEHADFLVQNASGFSRAPYVGHKGWISIDPNEVEDWNQIHDLIHESYRLIAPKKVLAMLDGARKDTSSGPSAHDAKTKAVRKPAAKK